MPYDGSRQAARQAAQQREQQQQQRSTATRQAVQRQTATAAAAFPPEQSATHRQTNERFDGAVAGAAKLRAATAACASATRWRVRAIGSRYGSG
jgi:hypothetical protein